MTDTAPHPSDQIPAPHLHFVYAAALRQTRDPHLAADITQAVFVLLARRIRQGRPPKETHMAGWLLNVTRFAVKESHRAATRRAYHEKKSAELRPESTPSSDATADTDPIASHLDAALLALPATDRELLIRRYLQSEPVHELAATLRIPPNTAAKRITRALDRLRTLLQRRGIAAPAALLTATFTTQSLIRTPPTLAAQILSTPTPLTPLAKSLLTRLTLAKLQLTVASAILLLVPLLTALAFIHTSSAPSIPGGPTPAETAVISSELAHIRAQIYLLRHSVITTATAEETFTAIRELVLLSQTNTVVVPELCAELDRTTADSELRALTFTLRAINDPRAVPALIRAIPKTALLVSDYGGSDVLPRDLWQFVVDHRLPDRSPAPQYPDFDVPRDDREITAALETMTRHSVGKASLYGAKDDNPESISIAQSHRQADADRWQQWWDAHWSELLTSKDLDSLHLSATEPDPIESAGLAAFGPLFPTGPHVHLGPIHDLVLPPQGLFDSPAYLNFATGRTSTLFENVSHPEDNLRTFTPWFKEADINSYTASYVVGAHPVGNSTTSTPNLFHGLDAYDTRTWCVDNRRWNTLGDELHNPAPLDLGPGDPHGDFTPRDPNTGTLQTRQYPATFLFITSRHTRGILQLLNSSTCPPGIHLRYRLIEDATISATQPRLAPASHPDSSLTFGPERTITLQAAARNAPCVLDLDNANLLIATTEVTKPDDPKWLSDNIYPWLTAHHADLISLPATGDPLNTLDAADMAVFPLTTKAWHNLTPAQLRSITSRRGPERWSSITKDAEHQSPATWAFKTRSGTTGLLQITNSTPTTLTLHYKLLTPPK